MLPFAPTLYEDENLMGWIARFKLFSGYRQADSVRDLFEIPAGTFKAQDIFNEPAVSLSSRLATVFDVSPSEMLVRHTIWPLWQLSGSMKVQTLRPSQAPSKKPGYRIMNDRQLSYSKCWHFCTACISDDSGCYGSDFWRISHQLPAVRVCLKHHRPLLSSPQLSVLNEMVLPQGICKSERVFGFEVSDQDFRWAEYIKGVYSFLQCSQLRPGSMLVYLKERLGVAQHVTTKHRTYVDSVLAEVESFYGKDFLSKVFLHYQNTAPKGAQSTNFIWATLRQNESYERHPIYILLLMFYLGINKAELEQLSDRDND